MHLLKKKKKQDKEGASKIRKAFSKEQKGVLIFPILFFSVTCEISFSC